MNLVYLGFGGNIGDRAACLAEARRRLAAAVTLTRCSRVYESEPVGLLEQPLFLNQVAAGETPLLPSALLASLKAVEGEMGRRPGPKGGPRTIDLDLLFYNDWVMAADGLVVPHPRLVERSFVLLPLCEIAPELVEPRSDRRLIDIWRENEARLARSWVYAP